MKKLSIVCVLVVFAGLSVATVQAGEAEDAAKKSATAWLETVDAGDFGKSWENASTLFRGAVTKEQWQAALKANRTPLGDVVSRKLESAKYATEMPGAPDGEYVVLVFATSFANKKKAVETVTPMKDGDGAWRVSGYFIR